MRKFLAIIECIHNDNSTFVVCIAGGGPNIHAAFTADEKFSGAKPKHVSVQFLIIHHMEGECTIRISGSTGTMFAAKQTLAFAYLHINRVYRSFKFNDNVAAMTSTSMLH